MRRLSIALQSEAVVTSGLPTGALYAAASNKISDINYYYAWYRKMGRTITQSKDASAITRACASQGSWFRFR